MTTDDPLYEQALTELTGKTALQRQALLYAEQKRTNSRIGRLERTTFGDEVEGIPGLVQLAATQATQIADNASKLHDAEVTIQASIRTAKVLASVAWTLVGVLAALGFTGQFPAL